MTTKMALTHPVKLVLKSTTTQTLSDRFTEMMRSKSPVPNRQRAREENIAQSRASAKNRRLAEQMSHRRDAVMDQFNNEVDVKSRLDQSRIKTNVKERLGRSNNFNGSVQNRLGGSRGGRVRGRSLSRGYQDNRSSRGGRSWGGRGRSRSSSRGYSRGSSQQRVGRFQGRSRGRGGGSRGGGRGYFRGRGRSRGRGRGNSNRFVDRGDLDNELDTYMSKSNGM